MNNRELESIINKMKILQIHCGHNKHDIVSSRAIVKLSHKKKSLELYLRRKNLL